MSQFVEIFGLYSRVLCGFRSSQTAPSSCGALEMRVGEEMVWQPPFLVTAKFHHRGSPGTRASTQTHSQPTSASSTWSEELSASSSFIPDDCTFLPSQHSCGGMGSLQHSVLPSERRSNFARWKSPTWAYSIFLFPIAFLFRPSFLFHLFSILSSSHTDFLQLPKHPSILSKPTVRPLIHRESGRVRYSNPMSHQQQYTDFSVLNEWFVSKDDDHFHQQRSSWT